MPAGTRHGPGFDPAGFRQGKESFPCTGVRVHLDDARWVIDLVTRFDHVAVALVVEAAMVGRVEAACHHLGNIPLRQQNVVRVIAARTLPADLDCLFQEGQDRLIQVGQPVRKRWSELSFGLHEFLLLLLILNL